MGWGVSFAGGIQWGFVGWGWKKDCDEPLV